MKLLVLLIPLLLLIAGAYRAGTMSGRRSLGNWKDLNMKLAAQEDLIDKVQHLAADRAALDPEFSVILLDEVSTYRRSLR